MKGNADSEIQRTLFLLLEFAHNLSNKRKIDFKIDLTHTEVLNKVIESHYVAPGNMFGTRIPFFPFREEYSLCYVAHSITFHENKNKHMPAI